MDSSWYEALVIILAVALAIFLILAIVITVKLIQVVKSIKRITDYAEKVADRADHISDFFEKTATPVAIAKLIANISDSFKKHSRKSKRGKD